MVGDQHADLALDQVADDSLNVQYRNRVDAREGFVQENELGVRRQGAGDLHAPAFAARQRDPETVADMADVKFLDEFFHHALSFGAIEVVAQLQDGADVVGGAELAEYRSLLRQVPQTQARPAVYRQPGHVPAVEDDPAPAAADQADDHVEGGGLAGAVGPEEADDFAAFNGDRQVLYHLARSVTLGYAEGFELVHGPSASSGGGNIVMDTGSPHSEEPEVIFLSSML